MAAANSVAVFWIIEPLNYKKNEFFKTREVHCNMTIVKLT